MRHAAAAPRWRRAPERSNVALLRCMVAIACHLGRPAARALLPFICLYFMVFSRGTRAASTLWLTRALGRPPRWRDTYRHYHAFAATLLDRVFLLQDRLSRFQVEFVADPESLALFRSGRGVLLMGAHMGSFEVTRTLGRIIGAVRVRMVMYAENAHKVNGVLHALNPALADDVILLDRPDAMLRVEESLEVGDAVGVLADRVLGDEPVARVPFLGVPAPFPLGPFRMAAILGAPVVQMVGLYRGGNRYTVHLAFLADFRGIPRQERSAAMAQAQARYVGRLEEWAREAPYNGFNFFDQWEGVESHPA